MEFRRVLFRSKHSASQWALLTIFFSWTAAKRAALVISLRNTVSSLSNTRQASTVAARVWGLIKTRVVGSHFYIRLARKTDWKSSQKMGIGSPHHRFRVLLL